MQRDSWNLLLTVIGGSLILQGIQGIANSLLERWLPGDYYLAPFDFLLSPFSLTIGTSLLFRWRYSRTFALGFCIFYLGFHILYFSLFFFFEGPVAKREELIFTGYFIYFLLCILALWGQKLLSFQTGAIVRAIRRGEKPYLLVTLMSMILITLGLVNIFFKDWFKNVLFYASESYFISSLMIFLGILLMVGWRYSGIFALVFSWFYVAISISEFLMARHLIHLVVPLVYFLLFTFMIMVLSSTSFQALFRGSQGNLADTRTLFDRTALRKGIVIFAAWNLAIGFLDLIFGSNGEGGFTVFRDVFLRLTGFSLILTSLGLFGLREWARKMAIALSSLSLTYMLTSLTWTAGGPDVLGWTVALALLTHVPSIFIFTRQRVKELFGAR